MFNLSTVQDDSLKHMFWNIIDHYEPTNCPNPCKQTQFDTQLLYKMQWSSLAEPPIWFIFDPVVSVTRSSFTISGQTLVTRLGGSVSSGRTLFWAVTSLLTVGSILHKMLGGCWGGER